MFAAAAAAALVIAGGVLLAVNRDDDGQIGTVTDPSTTVPDTVPPATTAPATTAPQTTPPTTSMDTTPSPVDPTAPPQSTVASAPTAPALVSSCPDAEITGNDTISAGGGFDTFGRLGADPSIVVTLPQAMQGNLLQTGSVAQEIQRVPGGQLVLIQVQASVAGWQLVVIDDDGSIRWRRCGTHFAFEAYAGSGGDVVHVRETDSAVGAWHAWRSFDLVSGADAEPLDVAADAPIIMATDRFALFGDGTTFADLQLVDLDTGDVTDLPDPGIATLDGTFLPIRVIDRPDGSAAVAVGDQETATLAVFVDGRWRTDRSTLLGDVPLSVVQNSVGFPVDPDLGNGVLARDALGATAWFHPIVDGIGGEGWATGVLGDVVLTNECRVADPTAPSACADPWHIALDLATGDLLWEQPGFVGVTGSGDGSAILARDDGWALVDLRTGDTLQELAGPFYNECCGLDTFVWSGNDGGVVWAVDHETIRIHYPEAVSGPTVEVDLR